MLSQPWRKIAVPAFGLLVDKCAGQYLAREAGGEVQYRVVGIAAEV